MQPEPPFYHLVLLWIELARGLSSAIAPDMQAKFGSRIGNLLIAAAVYIGTIEGRPMSVSKIASFVGMPRATVIRRLHELRRYGTVERVRGTYRTPADRVKRTRRQEHASMVRLVQSTCEKLAR
ncbi:helix-turn-helix domain-containing protein [Bradyrhizobium sp. Arg62]|uniref:helix-turn-helix domain-containing protein n=1 Tax=Bradyrhizobium brasilense TaxID=1419277 RepID=UPI003B967F29|nr:helix-turn-helix domain-containing protein [Bradyrhizobium brasilense]